MMAGRTNTQPRVLVVDDDEFLKMALKLGLERNGFRVELATSIASAVGALSTSSFDVLVTDLCIGVESGLELIDLVRVTNPETPVLLMSGSVTPDEGRIALASGAVRVLEKPFSPAVLAETIREVVSGCVELPYAVGQCSP